MEASAYLSIRAGQLLAAALLVGACGTSEEGLATQPDKQAEHEHVIEFLPVEAYDEGADDGTVAGLLLVVDGCAVLEMPDGGVGVIRWPFGSAPIGTSVVQTAQGEFIDFSEESNLALGGGVGEAERGLRLNDAELTECIERTDASHVVFFSGELAELAAVLSGDADMLESAAADGTLKSLTEAEARELLGAAQVTSSFDPEGELPCEPPMVPADLAVPEAKCYWFPDEVAQTTDLVVVVPDGIAVVGQIHPTREAIERAVEIVLEDPTRIDDAMNLITRTTQTRRIADFGSAVDLASTEIEASRMGSGYLILVGSTPFEVEATAR